MQLTVQTDWNDFIKTQQQLSYWVKLDQLVTNACQNSTVYPAESLIFQCFNYFNIANTKVVILGQDPYYLPNLANGLAFSVNPQQPLPKSLINIYQELMTDIGIKRTNGDLSDWAKQGILLLNASLTVTAYKPNSHLGFGWEIFTDNVIRYINQHLPHVVYVLWGNYAKSKKYLITNSQHLVLTASHPSPLSAYYGFFGSKPFSKINAYLAQHNLKTINW